MPLFRSVFSCLGSSSERNEPSGSSSRTGSLTSVEIRHTRAASGIAEGLPQVVAEEPSVGQDQHGRLDLVHQTLSKLTFVNPPPVHGRRDHGVRAAFGQTDQADLREGALATLVLFLFERFYVFRCVGNVEY